MESPLVSVIIPNYNYARFLTKRIDSVLNQTYENLEVIILDDKSTDDSRSVIESYRKDPRVTHILFNETNSGSTFKQWQKGFELAQGTFIWIAEADDYAAPTLIEKLIENMAEDADIKVGFVNSYWVAPDRQFINSDYTISEGKHIYDGKQFVCEHLLKENYIYNASMVVFRRDVYDKANPDYKQFRYCGDWHFRGSVCAAGRIIEVHDMLSRFRQHQRKVTEHAKKDVAKRWNDEMKTIAYIASLCDLTALEQRCLKGRLSKRLRKADMTEGERQQLRNEYPALCNGSTLDMICYEVGKNLFGFLHHRENMGFLSKFF